MIDLDEFALLVAGAVAGSLLTATGVATTDHFVGAVAGISVLGGAKLIHVVRTGRAATGGER